MAISQYDYDNWVDGYGDVLEQLQRAGFSVEYDVPSPASRLQPYMFIQGPPRAGDDTNRENFNCDTIAELQLFCLGWLARAEYGGPVLSPGDAPALSPLPRARRTPAELRAQADGSAINLDPARTRPAYGWWGGPDGHNHVVVAYFPISGRTGTACDMSDWTWPPFDPTQPDCSACREAFADEGLEAHVGDPRAGANPR